LPNSSVYLEIIKEHTSGCYDSLGLCRVKTSTRNGENEDGWGLRIYGPHDDRSFSGAWHGGNSKEFF